MCNYVYLMMGKLADGDNRMVNNMIRNGDLFNDFINVPYFSLPIQQKIPVGGGSVNGVSLQSSEYSSSAASSSSSCFSNGFCSPEDGSPFAEREKRIMKNHGEMFNDVLNAPYFSPLSHQQRLISSRVSLQSPEGSPPSDFLSNGFSSNENGSLYMALLSEESKYQIGFKYSDELCLDSKSPHDPYKINERLIDEIGLSQRFSGMNVGEEQNGGSKMKGFDMGSDEFGFGFNGNVEHNLRKYGSYGDFNNGAFNDGAFDIGGFQSSFQGASFSSYDDVNRTFNGLQGGLKKDSYVSMGSSLAYNQSNDFCSGSGWYNNRSDYLLEQKKEQGGSWINWDMQMQNPSITEPYFVDPHVFPQRYEMDSMAAPQSMDPRLDLNVYDAIFRNFRTRGIPKNGFSHFVKSINGAGNMESLGCEDSFIIQGKGLNHFNNKGREPLLSSDKRNDLNEISVQNLRGISIKLDNSTYDGGRVNVQKISTYAPLPLVPNINSLSEVQGKIYLMAQDQNGCRWLQRIFDEGTKYDIEIIFNEIIDHVVELMLKPFGNYVIQKFLDVCDEKQRLQIVLMVTEEPGQLVRICLNTYGTRAVQKLIETLKTRHQISFVILALKPGFLDLVKDQNGNHAIQRCLQCLSHEDNKFIFDAAAKFCVEIATHRHGCCVMQRCITHSTGKSREQLVTEISRNSLLLAQDAFGNYVVQYIIELKIPYAVVNLLSQFKRHYVHLSMQKFSSHVVEKCLNHLEESREQIVRELISVSHFEQLVQDPFANYVIQSVLAVTKGPLHSLLVDAVRPHMILRTNPYSKRIFSRNLLKN